MRADTDLEGDLLQCKLQFYECFLIFKIGLLGRNRDRDLRDLGH